jgi:DNA integrity scanning protein DisA with diadenylate cyclase activity
MKNTAKGSIKLLLISFIISLLVSMFSNLRIGTFFHLFVYFLSFLVLPDWLRNNNINWGMKLFLTIFVGVISIATITYIYGTGRILHRYTIIFCVVIICLIVENCIKKNIKGKN